MKKILFFYFILFTTSLLAQVSYEAGYYVSKDGNRVNGLIENFEWYDNPESINFKRTDNSEKVILTIEDISEFGINDGPVFTTASVAFDISSQNENNLSEFRSPKFELRKVLLKKVIEGKASLYNYNGSGVTRFFYKKSGDSIKPLVYKRFITPLGKIGTNELYKQTLKTVLDCEILQENSFKQLNYKTSSLSKIFKKYSDCENEESTEYQIVTTKTTDETKFNLRLKAGVRSNDFSFIDSPRNRVVDFPSNTDIELALETEYILGFNRNKWSLIGELAYFQYQDETVAPSSSGLTRTVAIDYSAIELGVGGRHSMFVGDASRIFLSAKYIVPFNLNQSFTRRGNIDFDEFANLANLGFGLGFEFQRYSIEGKYGLSRSLINGLDTKYTSISLSFGYQFL